MHMYIYIHNSEYYSLHIALKRKRSCDICSTTGFDLVSKPDGIYSYIYIKIDNKLVNIVILQWYAI